MKENEIKKLFGERVRKFRKRAGFTQDVLSERIGKTPDTVSNIESGFSSTRIKTAASIAVALCVPLKELFDFEPLTPEEREMVRVVEQVAGLVRSCDDGTRKGVVEVLEGFLRVALSRESD